MERIILQHLDDDGDGEDDDGDELLVTDIVGILCNKKFQRGSFNLFILFGNPNSRETAKGSTRKAQQAGWHINHFNALKFKKFFYI